MQYLIRGICSSFLILSLSVSSLCLAQSDIPPSADPSRIDQEFRPFSTPKSSGEVEIPGQTDLRLPADVPDVDFVLKGIELTGVTEFSNEEIETIFETKIGTTVSLRALYEVVNSITAYYRNRGFILSQAVLPEQEISADAPVKITVIEGFISNVTINTEEPKALKKIERYLANILRSKPLRARDLERYLLLLNDIPGYSINATLSPSDVPNAADLTLNAIVDDREYSIELNNRGNDFLGPARVTATAGLNNLSPAMNSASITLSSTLNEELNYASFQHSAPLGTNGLIFRQLASFANSQPGGLLEPLEIESDTQNLELELEYPIIRARRQNFIGHASFDTLDNESKRLGSEEGPETEDKIRSIRLGITYDRLDRYRGLNLIEVNLSQGIDTLNASGNSRLDGAIDYSKIDIYAARLQALSQRFSLFTAINAQHSDDILLGAEQFGIGGRDFGGAFDSSEITGDSGIAGRIELRFTTQPDARWINGLVQYAYLDGGEVDLNRPSVDEEQSESLSSTGLGLRFDLIKNWGGYIEYSIPLSNEVASEGDDDGRVFFAIKNSF